MQRNTIQRTMILNAVRSVQIHPTAEEVYEIVQAKCPSISRATVYRVLGNLAEEGEILRVRIADAPDRFDLTLKPHAHCFCEICGRVFDIGLDSFPIAAENSGFAVKSISVTVRGICADCRDGSSQEAI